MMQLNKYIDTCLIQEYGTPNPSLNAFELDLDDVPEHEIDNFLHVLMSDDTNVRDFVRHSMQKLIEKRLQEVNLT